MFSTTKYLSKSFVMDNHTPKNLQELLKFAIRQQQTNESKCVQLDEDNKAFLDQVLQSMSVNVTEEFLKAISILQDSSNDQDKAEALDLIRDYIDNIDFANSFIKIEGADVLINCVKNANHDVCTSANNIVAEMAQNNVVCQTYFHKYGTVKELTKYLSNNDQNLVASALYALSALTQNFEPAITEFIQIGGIGLLTNCLSTESPRVFSRACSLITSMSCEFMVLKDEFAKHGVVNILIKKLRIVDSFDAEMEMVLRTISVLIESRHNKLNEREIKDITKILQTMVKNNGKLPECEEIVMFSNSILKHFESTN